MTRAHHNQIISKENSEILEIRTIKKHIKHIMKNLPMKARKMVTTHTPYNYFYSLNYLHVLYRTLIE